MKSFMELPGVADVCDVGGGRQPLFVPDDIEPLGVHYTVLDISATELELGPASFDKVCADIATPWLQLDAQFDLVFTKMVAEHIASPRHFHTNVFNALRPGGYAIHLLPTMYSTPFIINRLTPERLSNVLLDRFAPRDRSTAEKFPAYYRWTMGPTSRQLDRLESTGFEVVSYTAGYGHTYYDRIPVVRWAARKWFDTALRHEWKYVCNYSLVVLRKPG